MLLPLAILMLTGCAAMQPATTEAIAKLPVVRIGAPPPNSGEYIIHYPAGYEFPVTLSTRGSLFASDMKIKAHTTLSRDLYLYKYWASHDGRHWANAHALLNVEFDGGVMSTACSRISSWI